MGLVKKKKEQASSEDGRSLFAAAALVKKRFGDLHIFGPRASLCDVSEDKKKDDESRLARIFVRPKWRNLKSVAWESII